jgi:hypothetical protein
MTKQKNLLAKSSVCPDKILTQAWFFFPVCSISNPDQFLSPQCIHYKPHQTSNSQYSSSPAYNISHLLMLSPHSKWPQPHIISLMTVAPSLRASIIVIKMCVPVKSEGYKQWQWSNHSYSPRGSEEKFPSRTNTELKIPHCLTSKPDMDVILHIFYVSDVRYVNNTPNTKTCM